MNKNLVNYSISSIVGDNSTFNGIFISDGPFRIDGFFKGVIFSEGKIIVGKTGKAECLMIGKNIIIGGVVKGEIIAEEKVVVLKSAEIFGEIYSTNVNMEEGVIFNGTCKICNKDEIKALIEIKRKENSRLN